MKTLRSVHRWIGIILTVFITLIALSGGILIFKESILRVAYPALSLPVTEIQKENYPEILTKIENRYQEPSVTFLRFPRHGMNTFHLWLSDGTQVFIDPDSTEIITQWHWYESFTNTLFQLHAHLLSDDIGEMIVGCIGLSILFFLISGVLLWWPRRKVFKIRDAVPRPAYLIRSHYTIGVIFLPFILLFVATGTTMVFYRPVTQAVTTLLDQTTPMLPDRIIEHKDQPYKSWGEMLQVINANLSEGEIQSWSPSKAGNAVFVFRKRMPEEWHPFGRTFILLDPYNAKVVQIIDARQQQTGMKIMEKVYPLHAVRVGGLSYKIVSVISAVSLLVLTIMGVTSFFQRLRKPER